MKERSITLRAHDVQAILEGRKTQTRFIVKGVAAEWLSPEIGFTPEFVADTGNSLCPYGQPGDVLYVKEAFQVTGWSYDHGYFVITYADGERHQVEGFEDDQRNFKWIEQCGVDATKAGRDLDENDNFVGCEREDFRNRSSIHMPRQAARIFLRITDVRVERLQDISEEDAKAEGLACISKDFAFMESQGREPTYKYGIPDSDGYPGSNGWPWSEWDTNPVAAFEKMWQETRGTKSWMANPWVWVISWEVIKKHQ